jgi:hypothetical protein
MEDKRCTKRSHSPSKEGSSSPSGGSTPPSTLSGSPPPPGSPSEISSCRPCSSVFEQGSPSEKVLVVDLSSSSDEEGLIPDTSRDEEFTRRLFGDLKCRVLGPSSNGKVIILSNYNEEEEVREEDVTDAKAAPSSVVKSPAPTASAGDVDDADKGRSPYRHCARQVPSFLALKSLTLPFIALLHRTHSSSTMAHESNQTLLVAGDATADTKTLSGAESDIAVASSSSNASIEKMARKDVSMLTDY